MYLYPYVAPKRQQLPPAARPAPLAPPPRPGHRRSLAPVFHHPVHLAVGIVKTEIVVRRRLMTVVEHHPDLLVVLYL